MGIFSIIGSFFSGGGMSSIEKIALESIDTVKETAEAKALMIKTLDPNGKMRRDLSAFASKSYGFYLISTTLLIFIHSFGGTTPDVTIVSQSKEAIDAMTDLFTPITAAWGTIVTASFGVNGVNAHKGS
ncbi:MAG: hypothetical protein V3T88_02765 [Nitrosomonadaceae bacterium]